MFENLRHKPSNLDRAIDSLADMIDDASLELDDRDKMIAQLERLANVRTSLIPNSGLSADAQLKAFAHLAGIAMIVGHERANVVTSKAVGLLQKIVI